MLHEGEDTIDVLPAMALCFVLGIMMFFVGVTVGQKRQKVEAVKAGVAHWGQDEYGNVKFEFNK